MKETFSGLIDLTEKDIKEMISNSIIVFDTNILLNLYRVTSETANNMLNAYDTFKEQIWIPYYVGVEYYKNKNNVISNFTAPYKKYEDELTKKIDKTVTEEFRNIFKLYKKNSKYMEFEECIKTQKKDLKDKLDEFLKPLLKDYNSSVSKIENRIENLIDKKITKKLEESEFLDVLKEGELRIINDMPPGYKDKCKNEYIEGIQVNGDYIIFNSIIELSKEKNKDIVFISSDNKDDWLEKDKKTIRYELKKEFFVKTGNRILLLTSDDFIEYYNKITKDRDDKISSDTKNELINLNEKITIDSKNILLFSEFLQKYKKQINSIKHNETFELFKRLQNEIDAVSPFNDLKEQLGISNKLKSFDEQLTVENFFNRGISE